MSFEVKTLTKPEKTDVECSGCSSSATEEGRGFRVRKRLSEPMCCPICSCTVRPMEIDQHFALEVDRLDKLSSQRSRKLPGQQNHACGASTSSGSSSVQSPSGSSSSAGNSTGESAWGTYQKIKSNRQTRLKMKSKKRKLEHSCPICDKSIPGTEDINVHVEACLKKSRQGRNSVSGSNSSDDDSIDIDGEFFEEYEFAGQTRIRATSMVEGGLGAAGVGTVVTKENPDEDDEDLNVDGDDTQVYGPSQYSEKDVIPPPSSLSSEEENGEYLRRLVTGSSSRVISPDPPELEKVDEMSPYPTPEAKNIGKPHEITIEALKQKILEFERGSRNKCKCLICLDEFRVPVVSISCWHVHCEECWLRTLGARKLCPQCNMITSPSDLRRIYL
ncbi:E3 ubiquitin-protein ligase RNF220-like [Phlebotomus argentipes]|uniref:E3 ubiquitin-protein ligase RNF220-like n=1 Tax=Phlebotomus argentipes TaxID=94469 RepID=UPI00289376E1|nr:E3 ubiquitin-protein ligase RNF220-like [Phlebotomus argentipes]XP_059609086.1 E3 ubiquitin-protein ligase RNF220-like [Phlebotomus argentipes]